MQLLQERYKYLFIPLLLLFFNTAFAQKQYNSWVFGDSCSIIFNNNQIIVNSIYNTLNTFSNAMICDKHTRQLLFSSDGQFVFDRNGNIMPNGNDIYGCESSSQAALIVPNPKNDSTYYLFTTDCAHNGGYLGLNYSIVDMRLNGDLGDVTQKNTFLCDNRSEKVTAVRACSFDGFWIITYVDSLRDFFAWRLTTNGIIIDSPMVSPSSFSGYSNLPHDIGYLKSSPNGNMLMCAYGELYNDTCAYLYNFDKNTGKISLITKIPNFPEGGLFGYDCGVSFSPDNSKAYFTNILEKNDGQSYLYQINVNAGTSQDILNSLTLLYQSNFPNGALFCIQIGADGKIYVDNNSFIYLAIINQPNLAGSSCDFQLNGISLSPHLGYDVPNNIDALYYPDTLFAPNFSYSVNCANSTATFIDNSNITPQEWWWSFGDAASGSNNHSTLQNPTHQFTVPGTYIVSMWVYEGCAVDSVIKTVTVSSCPVTQQLIIPTLIYGLGSQTQWQIINLPQGNNSVTIYDELGRTLYKTSNYPNNYDMRNLPPAMYFYRLTLESGRVYVGKIVLVK